MTSVFLSLGSNIQPQENLCRAIEQLQTQYDTLEYSKVYKSAAVGFDGPSFLNLAIRLQTEQSLEQVLQTLHTIEENCGRNRNAVKFSSRTVDIDLLLYGDLQTDSPTCVLPRPEILTYAFVLLPLSELIPNTIHPQKAQTYAQLWESFDHSTQMLHVDNLFCLEP
jgi:2-amino-4-hydroxy-6-hydroxymethyldihydropteridine diphosphokinase